MEEKDRTIEETFEKLEEIIGSMENGECTLEESFRYYEAGIKLVKSCNEKIDKVEKEILVLSGEEQEDDV